MNIIQTRKLSFSYGRQAILQNLSLNVPKGSIYGFLGPNGAGKSTTIKLLLGLLRVSQDNVFLFEESIQQNRQSILARTGNLIESPSLYGHLTATENLQYLNAIYKQPKSRINDILKMVGLWESKDKKTRHFSMGMKQRLSIGMALFHDAELIILDEPVNGMDPKGVVEIRNLLLNLQKEGKTIFISSHILSEIEKLCSHVGIISKGELLYEGTTADLLSQTSRSVLVRLETEHKAGKYGPFTAIESSSGLLSFSIENNSDLNRLLAYFIENNMNLQHIETRSGTLEEVFITLTSKQQ